MSAQPSRPDAPTRKVAAAAAVGPRPPHWQSAGPTILGDTTDLVNKAAARVAGVGRRASDGTNVKSAPRNAVKRPRALAPLADVPMQAGDPHDNGDEAEDDDVSDDDDPDESAHPGVGSATPRGKRRSTDCASTGGRWTVAEDAALRLGVAEVRRLCVLPPSLTPEHAGIVGSRVGQHCC